MGYTKTNWVDDETPLSAEKMNNLEKQYDAAKTDLDAHKAENAMHGWRNIKIYDTPGAYEWEAPDLNNGQPYIIGVYMLGGGGSGGATRYPSSSTTTCMSTGGGSGYAQIFTATVEPTEKYPVVVGSGGASITTTEATQYLPGENGGSSSFMGHIALGGSGGNGRFGDSAPIMIGGADGGVGSDAIRNSQAFSTPAPYYGMLSRNAFYSTTGGRSYLENGGFSCPPMSYNPFGDSYYLSAGGGALSNIAEPNTGDQETAILNDGSHAGAGLVVRSAEQSAIGNNATGFGNGGGGIVLHYPGPIPVQYKAISGAGSGGVVLIYAKGL